MFEVSRNKGFHMTFANGWTASVQWGSGNYCDNYSIAVSSGKPVPASNTAEIARWKGDGPMDMIDPDSTVRGRVTADEVLVFLNETAAL